ncbi:cbxX/cfqX, partial [Streptococcus gordonii]|nr:cbxX/cfqX [Streptococcus gordonii]
ARDLITEIEDGCDYLVGREVAKSNPQTPSSGSASDTTVPATTATASEKETKRDALEELNSLIGLEKVKHEIKKMINMVEFNKKRIATGKAPEKQTLHAAFMGNPGTGKT